MDTITAPRRAVPVATAARRSGDTSALALLGGAVLTAQAAVMLVASHRQHASYNLGLDFSIFYQAWWQISRGDLSPVTTTMGYPFWQSHLELLMWPLALLAHVDASGLLLLWLQDLATVGAGAAAYWWLLTELGRRPPGVGLPAPLLAVSALVLLVANPWVYLAARADFHFQAVAVLFTVLAGRELWTGHSRRLWLWVGLALTTGDVAGSYVAGLGLSALLLGRERRRRGLALVVLGVGWVAVVAALGSGRGSALTHYAWLLDMPAPGDDLAGALAVGLDVLRSPGAVWRVLEVRGGGFLLGLLPTGLLGLLFPPVAGVCLLVAVANVLHPNPSFSVPSFQTLPVYVLGALGTVLLLDRAARRRGLRAVAGAALLLAVATSLVVAGRQLVEPDRAFTLARVDPTTAAQLDGLLRRVGSEPQVVATFGVVGRFSAREVVHVISYPGLQLPVDAGPVVFVLAPRAGNQGLPVDYVADVARYARDDLGGRPLLETPQVSAYLWDAPPGGALLRLP